MFPLSPYDVTLMHLIAYLVHFGKLLQIESMVLIVNQEISSSLKLPQQTHNVLFAVDTFWASQINPFLAMLTRPKNSYRN